MSIFSNQMQPWQFQPGVRVQSKVRLHLLPMDIVLALAAVFEFNVEHHIATLHNTKQHVISVVQRIIS